LDNHKLDSNNSRAKTATVKALCRLALVTVLVFPVIAGVDFFNHVQATELNATFSGTTDLSKEDERMVDQLLEETLGINPATIAKGQPELAKASIASGFSVYTGYGVENNILNSDWLELDSPKYHSTADFFYSRKKNKKSNFNLYVFLNYSHYPDLDTESDRHELFTRAKGTFWIDDKNSLGAALSYLHQLSFDTDNTVEDEPIPEYKNEEVVFSPFWERDLGSNCSIISEIELRHKETKEPTDNFDLFKLTAQFKKGYDKDSENRIVVDAGQTLYDEGEILDLEGYPLEGTSLKTESLSLSLSNSHFWSTNSVINLKSKLMALKQEDNGPGYYNYDYYYLEETLQIQWTDWKFSSTVSATQYRYAERKSASATGDSETIYNLLFEIDAVLELKIGTDFLAKIEAVALQSTSNDQSMEYSADSILVGFFYYF